MKIRCEERQQRARRRCTYICNSLDGIPIFFLNTSRKSVGCVAVCFAFPTTPMIGLSQERERERERDKKANETEKTGNISMDDDEQQKISIMPCGGLGGISFSLSLSPKEAKRLFLLQCAAKPNPSCLKVPT